MPFLTITLIEGHTDEQKREVREGCTEVLSRSLDLPPDHIWVRFDEFNANNAGRAGVPYTDIEEIEIKVIKSETTNINVDKHKETTSSSRPWKAV